MSAQVTEAHRELARRIMFEFTQAGTATASDVRMAAQIIADSEARACDQLRAEVERLRDGGVQRIKDAMAVVMDERDSFKARAERAEAELAAERARLDWFANYGDTCWHDQMMGVLRGEDGAEFYADSFRAAIDAAMKEGA